MKAKTKLTKLWTILLSLVMLLSLLPTTALAATYAEVKVNGVSLGDGEYLTSNAATAASSSSTKPTTYVAWYKDGVLTLKNFTGKLNSSIVVQGAVAGDLTIKLIGDNTITPYDTGIQGIGSGGSITITADSGSNGKLTINMPNSERSAFGISSKYLCLEITEQDALSSSDVVTDKIRNLKARGHRFLIDDFGMGHTSLMYLQTNYFDVVKLDGALTRDILTNERNRDIISSIVYLGKSLHFKIIAEYVETKEQRNKLKELGCDAFQGYLYSKPLEFDELIRWLEQHK